MLGAKRAVHSALAGLHILTTTGKSREKKSLHYPVLRRDARLAQVQGFLVGVGRGASALINQFSFLYSELNHKIYAIRFQPDEHAFHAMLGQLSIDSDKEGKGLISALVVRKEDGRPGQGFFTLAKELGRNTADSDRCWLTELDRVYREFA